ncbi:helix-turn-helix domain-containing protein [Calidifontibacter sp. DB0510]|uniref:Helix-turn-helix domain-containing protein n=1 Tax=Metallococcus carri TaxID=1656884 RepID=A0A967AZW4_9MICO|nr:helix-turn-helix domain-containing protein [Metallococcus carri]NHN55748.1 helix-turn-helix domain-containing protein [Metallococcus carri]NOP38563.1 helix-turn-helix domain-containing protein [Calidifontibacter sp. DB2511S]
MTSYTATVETAARRTPADLDAAIDALEAYHGAIGTSVLGRLEATITLDAETLRQATQTAVAVVADALGSPAVAVNVAPTADVDRAQGRPPIPELLSVADAAERLGVTRQAILQRIDSGAIAATKVGKAYVVRAADVTGSKGA